MAIIKMKDKKGITSIWFEFMDWKKCFQTWRSEEMIHGDNIQLVVSTHPYSSGYWIEKKGNKLSTKDYCYIGKEVYDLEKRVIKGIALAEKEHSGVTLIL